MTRQPPSSSLLLYTTLFRSHPRRVNPVAAELYAALGYVPAPHTLFAGISKLPPAHLLVADHAGVTLRRYWDAAAAAARSSRLDGPATLRTALLRAVERELMSDVPVGVFTSGGPRPPPAPGPAGPRGGRRGD